MAPSTAGACRQEGVVVHEAAMVATNISAGDRLADHVGAGVVLVGAHAFGTLASVRGVFARGLRRVEVMGSRVSLHYEVVRTRDPSRPFRWRLVDDRGRELARSVEYATKAACLDALAVVMAGASKAMVHDLT